MLDPDAPHAGQQPSILASPRRNALRVHRHTALFLGHPKLDRLPLLFAASCITALRLFLLLRRLGQCPVDLFQFVDEVEAIEAVVRIGLTSDWAMLWGAAVQADSPAANPQRTHKSCSAAH